MTPLESWRKRLYESQVRRITAGVDIQERRTGASLSVGRRVWELINLGITLKSSIIMQSTDGFILETFKEEGRENSVRFSLARNATNNFLDPSEGSKIRVSQQISGGFLGRNKTVYGDSSGWCIFPPY